MAAPHPTAKPDDHAHKPTPPGGAANKPPAHPATPAPAAGAAAHPPDPPAKPPTTPPPSAPKPAATPATENKPGSNAAPAGGPESSGEQEKKSSLQKKKKGKRDNKELGALFSACFKGFEEARKRSEDKKQRKKGRRRGTPSPATAIALAPEDVRCPSPGYAWNRKTVKFDDSVRIKAISATALLHDLPSLQDGYSTHSEEEPNIFEDDPDSIPVMEPCRKRGFDNCSLTSQDHRPLFDPSQTYSRQEVEDIIEALAIGINNRETLKTRYDEETARLGINREFQLDQMSQNQQRIQCLRQNLSDVVGNQKDSLEVITRNYLQLAREKRRLEGAIDLKEDFDLNLQDRITKKDVTPSDLKTMLTSLEGLMEDTCLQWVQKETMMSTEAEALERVHMSAERELSRLTEELQRYQADHAARHARNVKLGRVVEQELEKFSHKQQEIINHNEKRIRALEGCIRTMQLDREVMYSEMGENRQRLKEVLEGRVNAFMGKARKYRDILTLLNEEMRQLSYRPGSLVRVSEALARYAQMVSVLDIDDLSDKVALLRSTCERIENCWKSKNNQRRDLNDIRKCFVEQQRQHMLTSEEEYFLTEPVEVPGMDSVTNFLRSNEDLTAADTRVAEDFVDEISYKTEISSIQPFINDTESNAAGRGKSVTIEEVGDSLPKSPRKDSKRMSVLDTMAAKPKEAAEAVGKAIKRLSQGMGLV